MHPWYHPGSGQRAIARPTLRAPDLGGATGGAYWPRGLPRLASGVRAAAQGRWESVLMLPGSHLLEEHPGSLGRDRDRSVPVIAERGGSVTRAQDCVQQTRRQVS